MAKHQQYEAKRLDFKKKKEIGEELWSGHLFPNVGVIAWSSSFSVFCMMNLSHIKSTSLVPIVQV